MARPPTLEKKCTGAANKVGFSKTHKTASSTIQNIIFRAAAEKDWNVAMYESGTHLGPPSSQYALSTPFQSSWLDKVPWKPMIDEQGYNVFAFHTMWNKAEVEKVLGPGAVYFTIIRSPIDEFESLYNYVRFEKQFHMNLETFTLNMVKRNQHISRVHGYLGRNQQFWDLGRPPTSLQTVDDVRKQILEIEKEFDLVLISDDMDSSLVLLSDQLCWPLQSFTSLKINSRKKSSIDELSPETRHILKEWLWADEMLYSYFKEVLQQRKLVYGIDELNEQVKNLRAMNTEIKNVCIEKMTNNRNELDSDFKPYNTDVLGFKMNSSVAWCRNYGISEMSFIGDLRRRQEEKFDQWRLVNRNKHMGGRSSSTFPLLWSPSPSRQTTTKSSLGNHTHESEVSATPG